MHQVLKKGTFEFSVDQNFSAVIDQCRTVSRKAQHSTWISEEVKQAYIALHEAGIAHSAEAWSNGELVGGLYGIRMGAVFFGESMFSTQSNASKFAFIQYVRLLQQGGIKLIDCQVYTPHLESLGARMIPRSDFVSLLQLLI